MNVTFNVTVYTLYSVVQKKIGPPIKINKKIFFFLLCLSTFPCTGIATEEVTAEILTKIWRIGNLPLDALPTTNLLLLLFLRSAAPIYQGSPQRMFSNIRTEDLTVFTPDVLPDATY